MGLGIDLLVRAGFGLDPLSIFQSGLSNVFHISLGLASQLLMLSILLVLLFLDRSRIGLVTILNSVLVGAFVNWFAPYIQGDGQALFWLRMLAVSGGILFVGVGIGIYISACLGEAGIDALMVYFSEKFRLNIRKVRIILDIILTAAGFALGGRLGWATFVSMFVNGYIIQGTVGIADKILQRIT